MVETDTQDQVTVEWLDAFGDAWNRHDVDAIMSFFDDDCVFITGWGSRFEGRDRVRDAGTATDR